MPELAALKTCKDCGLVQPREDFPQEKQTRSGKDVPMARCRPCHNAMARRIQAGRKEKNAAYRKATAARRRQISAAWTANNRHRVNLQNFATASRKRGVEPDEIAVAYAALLVLDACTYCGATDDVGIDHATPICRGGGSDWWNLSACCWPCNRAKWKRTDEEFRTSLAR